MKHQTDNKCSTEDYTTVWNLKQSNSVMNPLSEGQESDFSESVRAVQNVWNHVDCKDHICNTGTKKCEEWHLDTFKAIFHSMGRSWKGLWDGAMSCSSISSAYVGFNLMPVHIMEQVEVDINSLITGSYILTF
jgi:hypothetical protein